MLCYKECHCTVQWVRYCCSIKFCVPRDSLPVFVHDLLLESSKGSCFVSNQGYIATSRMTTLNTYTFLTQNKSRQWY